MHFKKHCPFLEILGMIQMVLIQLLKKNSYLGMKKHTDWMKNSKNKWKNLIVLNNENKYYIY